MNLEKFIFTEHYNLKNKSYTLKFDFNIKKVGSSRNTFDCYSTLLYFLKRNPQKNIYITQDQTEDFHEDGDILIINLEKYQEFCNKIGKNGENRGQAFFSRRIQHFTEEERKELISQSEEIEIINWIKSLPIVRKHAFSQKLKEIEEIEVKNAYDIKNLKTEDLIKKFNTLPSSDVSRFIKDQNFYEEDFVNLAYRRKGLDEFEEKLENCLSDEKAWQLFFEQNPWIFGYGLDYRFMTIFDREMSVGDGGTQDQDKPTVDFLNEYNDFTVLVELKTPTTKFFTSNINRAGCWELSKEFISAFSQTLEQKAEWQIKGDRSGNHSQDGKKELNKRTRDPKIILIVGSKQNEIFSISNFLEKKKKLDTFELFRRDSRNIEIITYDELYERANFIVNNSA